MSRRVPEDRSILRDDVVLKDLRDVVISALLFILSYPPAPFGFLVYFAFIPLFSLSTRKTPATMAGLAYLTGLLLNWVQLSWIVPYAFPKFALLATLNALQFAMIGWWLSYGFRYLNYGNIGLFPFAWTALEHLRGLGDLAYNWLDISNTQTGFLYIAQMADIGGSDLLVLWICLLNVLIYFSWRKRNGILPGIRYLVCIAFVTGLPLLYGYRICEETGESGGIRVRIMQPDADPVIKWDPAMQDKIFRDLVDWTDREQKKSAADLVVWPETAIPFEIRSKPGYIQQIAATGVPVIAGVMDYRYVDGHKHRYNAVLAVIPGSDTMQVYHKMRPVPVEEGIPYQRCIPALDQQAIYDRYLSRGYMANPLEIPARAFRLKRTEKWWDIEGPATGQITDIRIGPTICFEISFHDPAVEQVQNGAEILLVITNDAWFGYSHQPFQHLSLAVLRAIETRRAVIFCANSGFSAFIDPAGRIAGRTVLFRRESVILPVPLNPEESFYIRNGNWVALISVAAVCVWALSVIYRRMSA